MRPRDSGAGRRGRQVRAGVPEARRTEATSGPRLEPALDFDAESLRSRLDQGLQQLGLEVSPDQLAQLLSHLRLVARWGQVYNLTAVRDPQLMLTQHTLDSLAVVQPVRRMVASLWLALPLPFRVLDVGSGAGFPGTPLATLQKEWQVDCVDTVEKKARFIGQVALDLGLAPRLRGLHARVEKLPSQPGYSLITSRAFASLPDFVALTRGLLAPGGVWVALKGKSPEEELAALPEDIEVFHVEPIAVPGLEAQRCLIWMRPRPQR